MKFEHEMRYDATPDKVYAMLADPSFRDKVCDALDVTSRSITVAPAGTGMKVEVDQTQRADGIPGFAKKFVGDEIHIHQAESWSSAAGADLEVGIPGKPGHLLGGITLAESGEGTLERVQGDIKVGIPLVGGKLEKMIGDLLTHALTAEHRVGREWLASGSSPDVG